MGLDYGKSEMNSNIVNENEWFLGMEFGNLSFISMAMKAAIELDVLQIISKAGNGVRLSPTQIVDHMPTTNPNAAIALDRILRVLASHSLLSCSVMPNENGEDERFYGLTDLCKYLVNNKDGLSLAPLVLINQDKVLMESWVYLRNSVLEGSQPFTKAHGMNLFEYHDIDDWTTTIEDPARAIEGRASARAIERPDIERCKRILNWGLSEISILSMEKILDNYEGFKGVKELVDVGGGNGSILNLIVSKYPHISGINFDLPHVIADAPVYTGVKHLAGNMFESVPSGEVIFMKGILHDWNDDHCRKLLKNCHKALPEKGIVIAVDTILPEVVETSAYARQGFHSDLMMLAYSPGGKERTKQEFQALAKETGFAGGVEPVCGVNGTWVMEFHK